MIFYDKNNNVMKIQKVTIPEIDKKDFDINPISNIRASYNKYCMINPATGVPEEFNMLDADPNDTRIEGTYVADVIYMLNAIEEKCKFYHVRLLKTYLAKDTNSVQTSSLRKRDHYYEVFAELENNGTPYKVSMFKIPYMDARGLLNVDGSLKVFVNALQASEDASYDPKKQTINVQLGNRVVKFIITRNVDAKYLFSLSAARQSVAPSVDFAVFASMSLEGIADPYTKIIDTIHNNKTLTTRKINPFTHEKTVLDASQALINVLVDKNYTVSEDARESINNSLQLDRALGETLSRSVVNYKGETIAYSGEVVTENLLRKFKENLVWKIYIKRYVSMAGLSPKELAPITFIPKGTRINNYMRAAAYLNNIHRIFTSADIYLEDPTKISLIELPGMVGIDGVLTEEQSEALYNIQSSLNDRYTQILINYDMGKVPEEAFEKFYIAYSKFIESGNSLDEASAVAELVYKSGQQVPISEVDAKALFYCIRDSRSSFKVTIGKDDDSYYAPGQEPRAYFDVEVVSNKMFKLRRDKTPATLDDTDYSWYYLTDDNGTLVDINAVNKKIEVADYRGQVFECNIYNGHFLNSSDLLALYSLTAWYHAFPESRILGNKDELLLKNIRNGQEIFKSAIRTATDEILASKSYLLKNGTWPKVLADTSFLFQVRKSFKTHLRVDSGIDSADMSNAVAVMAKVCNVNTVVNGKNSIVDDMRLLSPSYYGRICPYETPAGDKIGIVNHKAMGCKFDNHGRLLSLYRKVINEGGRCRLATSKDGAGWIRMMTAAEASKYRIGDILSLHFTSANCDYFFDTQVTAIVPNTQLTGDVQVPETVSSHSLQYVLYFPESHISSTAMLIPFIGADDTARISFGLSMQKQAILCMENQQPRVSTSMYKDIFDYMPFYKIIAKQDGEVRAIDSQCIRVIYDYSNSSTGGTIKRYRLPAKYAAIDPGLGTSVTAIAERKQVFMPARLIESKLRALPADVKMTEAELHQIPTVTTSTASIINRVECDDPNYVEYELTETNVTDSKEKIDCPSVSVSGGFVTFMSYDKIPGDKFKAGDVLAHASILKGNCYAPARNVYVAYIPAEGYNYEDAVVMSRECASHYTSITMHDVEQKLSTYNSSFSMFQNKSSYINYNGTIGYALMSNNRREKVVAKNVSGYYYDSICSDSRNSKPILTTRLLKFHNMDLGDKMAGRHGNKGVDAHIYENSEMPMFKNGKIVDVILNPCGVPSRMNIGQNLEAHLGFVADLLDLYIISDPFNGATLDDIRILMSMVYDMANVKTFFPNTTDVEGAWSNIIEFYISAMFGADLKIPTFNLYNGEQPWNWASSHGGLSSINDAVAQMYARQTINALKEHLGITGNNIFDKDRILDWAESFERSGTAYMWDPVSQKEYEYPIAFGVSYYLKLVQEADEKLNVRGGFVNGVDYNATTNQPPHGKSRGGGQRNGEMEMVTLAAYGAVSYLHEALNGRSDNEYRRYEIGAESLHKDTNSLLAGKELEDCCRANDNLRYELEAVGVCTELVGSNDKETQRALHDISYAASSRRVSLTTDLIQMEETEDSQEEVEKETKKKEELETSKKLLSMFGGNE